MIALAIVSISYLSDFIVINEVKVSDAKKFIVQMRNVVHWLACVPIGSGGQSKRRTLALKFESQPLEDAPNMIDLEGLLLSTKSTQKAMQPTKMKAFGNHFPLEKNHLSKVMQLC
jgi:hypothetical protein